MAADAGGNVEGTVPGESVVSPWKPFSRSDCGVSLKMKYSYSAPFRQECYSPLY